MKKLKISVLAILVTSFWLTAFAKTTEETILANMPLKEKIGQKLMLDFRYWCSTPINNDKACTEDFTTMNATVQQIISKNHIGGIILFSNNLKTIEQITTLTHAFQQAMHESYKLPLLIGTDQEGGIVARLPRDVAVSFPGNIAITAAYLGNTNKNYSAAVGNILAIDLKAVGINIDFAPDVDVNVNSANPIINVRSFSDSPKLVSVLGLQLSKAIQAAGVAATLKHFPGHGDTVTDSHVGLPIVEHSLDEAWKVDLYPFATIIKESAPDLIMTAHIQYPALDDSHIYSGKTGADIITPATLSRKIQFDLLRHQLGYEGVVITDALDMGAIAQNFDSLDATIKAFQAGDDVALMPVSVAKPEDCEKVTGLIEQIAAAVQDGRISEKELDESVLRILKLKTKLGLLQDDSTPLSEKISRAQKIIADQSHHDLETNLANDAVTLVQNTNHLLPLTLSALARIHILTPWLEQGAGMAMEIKHLQTLGFLPHTLQVSFVKMSETDFEAEKKAIDDADIVIVGYSTTKSLPLSGSGEKFWHHADEPFVLSDMLMGDSQQNSYHNPFHTLSLTNKLPEDQFAFQALRYATLQHKKTIFLSLVAPYDLPNYANVSDAMLAGYDPYGYLSIDLTQGYYRGPSMQALTRIIFGFSHAGGKLPVQVPNPNNPADVIYPRGYGLVMNPSLVK